MNIQRSKDKKPFKCINRRRKALGLIKLVVQVIENFNVVK